MQGYLVEKLSGQPFADFLQTRLFDPLGMKDTAFYVPKTKLARLARIHTDGPDGKMAPPTDSADQATVVPLGPSGGGGLYSTSDDYLRFAQMLLNGGELGRQALSLAADRADDAHESPAGRRAQDDAAGHGVGHGLPVVMDAAAAGEPTADGTFDWYGLAGTWFWIDPDDGSRVRRHDSASRPRQQRDTRPVEESRLPGARQLTGGIPEPSR